MYLIQVLSLGYRDSHPGISHFSLLPVEAVSMTQTSAHTSGQTSIAQKPEAAMLILPTVFLITGYVLCMKRVQNFVSASFF